MLNLRIDSQLEIAKTRKAFFFKSDQKSIRFKIWCGLVGLETYTVMHESCVVLEIRRETEKVEEGVF